MRESVEPRLLAVGAAAIAVGILVFSMIVLPGTGSVPAEAASPGPSRLWAFSGGLMLAVGLGLIGIGMNRWTSRRERGMSSDH